jgi:hypothetical protein
MIIFDDVPSALLTSSVEPQIPSQTHICRLAQQQKRTEGMTMIFGVGRTK